MPGVISHNGKTITDTNPLPTSLTGNNAEGAASVTPDDASDLTISPTKGIFVGVAGDVKVDMKDGTTVTFTNLVNGIVHPLSVKRVYATGTTATGIVAVY